MIHEARPQQIHLCALQRSKEPPSLWKRLSAVGFKTLGFESSWLSLGIRIASLLRVYKLSENTVLNACKERHMQRLQLHVL